MLKIYDEDGVLHTPDFNHSGKKELREKKNHLTTKDRFREVSYEQWCDFLINAPRYEREFYKAYLETLNVNRSVEEACKDQNVAESTKKRRRWELLNKVFPYIMFYFKNYGCKITREWLQAQWMSYLDSHDTLAQNALKELGKLCSFYQQPETNVTINNSEDSVAPVQINFGFRDDDE